ncbi:MAG: bifunctional 5,10-methylenetetrahydrofolate dehydrogenase/5,10-methenyltetrahydrofolate cyclohydrolase [Pseudomonadota bacterium]
MTATIIDGKSIAKEIRRELKVEVAAFREAHGVQPLLAAVLVGDDPASHVYVRNKQRACKQTGMGSRLIELPAETSEAELAGIIDGLNADVAVHGILVQSPLPRHMDEFGLVRRVDPYKDVDCFHPENVGLMAAKRARFLACTPAGVIELLDRSGVELTGANAVVLGRSMIVGRPLSLLLTDRHATVTVCHTRTRNLPSVCATADVLVAAAGAARLVGADWVKPGAVVIDVGTNRTDDGLCGDVDYGPVSEVAGMITPVPGGVGPMTIAMLMKNVLKAASLQVAANR